MLGPGTLRGRDCQLVEFACSDIGRSGSRARGSVRMWIDSAMLMLLQVEEYDETGAPVRTLSVRNFRKVGDMWMVKDIEVRSIRTRDRTIIRVERVWCQGASDAPIGLSEPAS